MSVPQLKYELFERALINPLHGKNLSREEHLVASMILDATAKQPIGLKRLRDALNEAAQRLDWDGAKKKFGERDVKDIIRTLRKKHELPIL